MRLPRRLLAAVLLLLCTATAALAHQRLLRSSPADGVTLDQVPDELQLVFSEPVALRLTRLQLVGPTGLTTALGDARLAADSPSVLIVPVSGPFAAGDHTLEWVTSGADGHVVRGSIDFTVADDAAGLAAPEPAAEGDTMTAALARAAGRPAAGQAFGPESAGYVAVRWATFAALLMLVGALSFRMLVLPLARRGAEFGAGLTPAASRRAAVLGLVGAGLLLATAAARLAAQSYALFGAGAVVEMESFATLLGGSTWAIGWWLQLGSALVAGFGFALVLGGRPAAGWALAAAAGLAAAFTPALSGHAAAAPALTGAAIASSALHVLAAGGWLGGLLVLIVAGIPATRQLPAERRGVAVAALVRAFSPGALLFAAILLLTGAFAAWLHAGSLGALLGAEYGQVLFIKLALLGVVAAIGAWNHLRVRPALDSGTPAGAARIRRSAAAELTAGSAVLLATAVLVALPTPADSTRLAEQEHDYGTRHEESAAPAEPPI